MPLYEYACRECGRRFERVVFGTAEPACPSCESREVSKLLSVFAVGSGDRRFRVMDPSPRSAAQDDGAGPCGSCGDPRGPGACSTD